MNAPNFYTVGGTISPVSDSYIDREVDRELLQRCRRGELVYISAPRQTGKSSLLVRTMRRLAEENIGSVIVDLTVFGRQATAEQWCFGLLSRIARRQQFDLKQWWDERAGQGWVQLLEEFFEQVLPEQIKHQLVIFLDEVDVLTGLPFSIDFLSFIRAFHLHRRDDPKLRRLSFVLAGNMLPDTLTHGDARPFDFTRLIHLTDFTPEEARPLAAGLGLPDAEAEKVLGWVLDWTGGHPYLTQTLCQRVAEQGRTSWSEADLEQLVADYFLYRVGDNDSNLAYVNHLLTQSPTFLEEVNYRLTRSPQTRTRLEVYERVLRGERVGSSDALSELLASGVVVHRGGGVQVRNRIYREAFNERWVARHKQPAASEDVSEPPPPKIFICYRRAAGATYAGRLFDTLTVHFGEDQVFMDFSNIPVGTDIVKVVEEAVSASDVMLVIIGRNWLESAGGGGRRLDDPNDFVRLEIAAALKRNLRVIPVLVQGTAMPMEQELPADMAPLARRQAIVLRDLWWSDDVERLIEALETLATQRMEERRSQEAERRKREAAAGTDGPPTGRWVAVAGTGSYELPEQVSMVSHAVGRALAQSGYGLVVGGWSGVDYVTAEAFGTELGSGGGLLEERLIQVVRAGRPPQFYGGRIIEPQTGTDEFEGEVEHAHALILIGGLGGTYRVYQFAQSARKPVFPIADTGADARKAFDEIVSNWATLAPPGIEREAFLELGRSLETEADVERLTRHLLGLLERLWLPAPVSSDEALARIVLVEGNLLDQNVDAIAHAVGTDPRRGGAVGVELEERLGPDFNEAAMRWRARLGPGETIVSEVMGQLSARYIIHTCSETVEGTHSIESNAQAVTGALRTADRLRLKTVALYAIGTGAAGFRPQEIARPALAAVVDYLERGSGLAKVIFAFVDRATYRAYLSAFQQMGGEVSARVLLPRFSPSSRHAIRLAEALRIRLGRERIDTTLLLYGLYLKAGAAQELLRACAGEVELGPALQRLLNIEVELGRLEAVPAPALAHVQFSPHCEEALIKARELAGHAELIRERQLLAGLLAVPECDATVWLVELSRLSAEQLWGIVAVAGEDEGVPIGPQVVSMRSPRTTAWRLSLGGPQVLGQNVEELRIGERFTLSLDLLPALPIDDERGLVLRVPESALELVGFIKARGFQLQGDNVFTIPVANGRPTERSFSFELVPLLSGRRAVEVEVYSGGRVQGLGPSSVGRTLKVAAPVALPDIKELIDRRRVPNPQPDVMLYVALEETPAGQRTRLYLTCHRLRLDREPLEPLPFNEHDLAALRQTAIRAAAGATQGSPRDVLAAMRSCGAMLFDRLFTGALQEHYYHIAQLAALSPSPWAWLIISDEHAMLPWECVCYYGVDPETGSVWYDDFLADKFLVSHWVGQRGLRLPGEAPVGQLGLVHYDQRPQELPYWRAALGGEEHVEVEEDPGRLSLLQPGSYCYGLHLLRYTEGRRSDRIVADDERERERVGGRNEAEDMTYEQRLDLTLRRPTVGLSFVNTRRPEEVRGFTSSDTHLEANWMMPLMHAGASALVGPRWPVAAEAARLFAREFYAAMRACEPLGLAVWRARGQVRAAFPSRPDWLAYTYFGHPQCEPYPVGPAQGFTLFEAIDQPDDRPFLAGLTYYFRAIYRTEAPAWYSGRLRAQQGALPDEDLSVMVMPLNGTMPETYPLTRVAQSDDLRCTVVLTMPMTATTLPVVVRFQKGSEELRTIMLNLRVKEGL